MRKLVVLAFGLCCTYTLHAQTWKQVVNEAGNFKVSFPTEHATSTQEQETEAGKIPVTTLSCMVPAGGSNLQYTAIYTFFGGITAGKPFEPAEEVAYFESIKANYTQGKAQLVAEQTGKYQQFSTYSLRLSLNDGALVVSIWNVIAGTRGYLLQVITPKAHAGNADIQKFFDSFELLSLPAGSSNH